jgi:MYXO-CTERM domain-containing protein
MFIGSTEDHTVNHTPRHAWRSRTVRGLLLIALPGLGGLIVPAAAAPPGPRRMIPQAEPDQQGAGFEGVPVPRRPLETGAATRPLVTRGDGAPPLAKNARTTRPQGFLAGKAVYLSPGHGFAYVGSWGTQRPNSLGLVEDFSNVEAVSQFLMPYLWGASADVHPVRETDLNAEMVILDNEDGTGAPELGAHEEVGDPALFSDSTQAGWGRLEGSLQSGENPFDRGGNRLLDVAGTATASFRYTFNVPADGHYHVYVSYSQWTSRASDAHYVVKHPGGEAHFRVDQKRHGRTWVLLGRFWFAAGVDADRGAVWILNDSAEPGTQVSADAVRLGGGRGVIDRGGGTSGWPRSLEDARYHAQLMGAPTSVYDGTGDDRSDDVGTRSRLAAWLHEDGEDALFLSWHSNAGGGRGTSTWIYWPEAHSPCDGSDAPAGSLSLGNLVQAEIVGDLRAIWDPAWPDEGRLCAWFGELNPSNNGEMPSALIEYAHHDDPTDVAAMKEARFRRIVSRAVYHAVVRYFADRDGVAPAFLPEPPEAPAARSTGEGSVQVSWSPPDPDPAGGDPPTSYRLYQSASGVAFDEGEDVGAATAVTLTDLADDEVRFFRITAVNAGGESLPSPVVGVQQSPAGRAPLLVIPGFTRLDAGLLWQQDTGALLGVVDRLVLDRMHDLATVRRHGPEAALHGIAFDTAHPRAAVDLPLEAYDAVDLAIGRGASAEDALDPALRDRLADYVAAGGNLLVSGSHAAAQLATGDALDVAFLGETLHGAAPDGAGGDSASGADGEILAGVGDLRLHRGDLDGYDIGDPDHLVAAASGTVIGGYGGSGSAAVRSTDGPPGATVHLGFPLEGIVDDAQRAEVMARILDFFAVRPAQLPDGSVPGPDAGDAGAADAGAGDAGTPPPGPGDDGCGCRGAPGSAGDAALPVLLGLALLARRRRRARAGR